MRNPHELRQALGTLAIIVAAFAGCDSESTTTEIAASTVGQCTRNPAVFEGDALRCGDNTACPCGSFCDLEAGFCTYACMPPGQAPSHPGTFPGNPSECATGNVCDDIGRCLPVGGPPGTSTQLGADPTAMTTVAGGPSKQFQVRLRLIDASPAEVTASEATVVHVHGRDSAVVSCDGTTFQADCNLTGGWTFAFNGQFLDATRVASVKTVTGTADDHGEVVLSIESTGAQLIVPAVAKTPALNEDGIYAGVATSPAYPAGIQITARARQHQLLVREPSRTIAPDGALLLDIITTGPPGPRRRTVWLRGADAQPTASGIVGEYGAGLAVIDPAARTLELPVTFDVPGADGLAGWTLSLRRVDDHVAECVADSGCRTGEVCASDLQACVPAAVKTPTTAPIGNALDDKRSADWWTAVSPMLGNNPTSATSPAFATTGADLIESLLCTVDETFPGRLSAAQLKLTNQTLRSRSGDLGCVDDGPRYPDGAPMHAPAAGAVGVATFADRDSNATTARLVDACMADLKRLPSTGSTFGGAFGVTVGACANLARFVPAVRLLASDELGKGTAAALEPRGRGLVVRLTQQWSMLNGLLASAGASQRDNASVLDPTPAATVRSKLLELFDTVDRGWSALLDKRVAQVIRRAVIWAPVARDDQSRDYRLVKKPVAYWTFNNISSAVTPRHDLIRGAELVPNATVAGSCAISTLGGFWQGFNCPGYAATLPATAPSLIDDPSLGGAGKIDNLTVTMNVDARDGGGPGTGGTTSLADVNACPRGGCDPPPDPDPDPTPTPPPPPPPPPYLGGTLIATPTLAVAESVNPLTLEHSIVLAHPTSSGVEWTTFSNTGELGPNIPVVNTASSRGTTIAVVRDALRKTYKLMIWRGSAGVVEQASSYQRDPVGTLDWVQARTIRVGAPGPLPAGHYWTPYKKSYGGALDDIAVFDSALSAREVRIFASARTGWPQRTVWPDDMALQALPSGEDTEDITVPLGAQLLEAQVAELELAARVMAAMQARAAVACDPGQPGAATARAEVDAATARAGRALRQSHLIEGIAAPDTSTRAGEARQVLQAKRMELIRALEPARCTAPFEMAENEVPLYHDSINPAWSETQAYFAASDHLIGLADERAHAALGALEAARQAYDSARQSQIQQAQSDQARDLRIEAIETQYGDGLRRLCGISDSTNHQIVKDLYDPDPERPVFYVDTCYVEASDRCLGQDNRPLADLDPTCYRGQIGENLMGLRVAYHAQEVAIQSWRAAIDSSIAAQKFCILKQRDLYGTGGMLELTAAFDREVSAIQDSKRFWTSIGNLASAAASAVGSRLPVSSLAPPHPGRSRPVSAQPAVSVGVVIGIAVVGALVKSISDYWGAGEDMAIEERRRKLDETLAFHAARADIVACWNQAGQYERATQGAELAANQAIAQLTAAGIGFINTLGEARQITVEAPAAMTRELTRPTIPFAFHYWLDERIATYERLFATARRYTYVALRATEYDKQTTYKAPEASLPQRAGVLGATHPQQLVDQIMLMRNETNTRNVFGRSPGLGWTTLDLGQRFWGLPISSPLIGVYLSAYLRDVYSTTGDYLGRGLRFSLIPASDQDEPVMRCAERIWRVSVGAGPISTNDPGHMVAKVIKRNLFASRVCRGDGKELQPAIWRPESNLLAGGGDATTFEVPVTSTPANTPLVSLTVGDELERFRNSGTPPVASSTELSLQGLYGDYILLFPKAALDHGFVPHQLSELDIRFDHISIDDTHAQQITAPAAGRDAAAPVRVELGRDRSPIVLD